MYNPFFETSLFTQAIGLLTFVSKWHHFIMIPPYKFGLLMLQSTLTDKCHCILKMHGRNLGSFGPGKNKIQAICNLQFTVLESASPTTLI